MNIKSALSSPGVSKEVLIVWIVVIAAPFVGWLIDPGFASLSNFNAVVRYLVPLFIVSIAQAFAIMVMSIDLSVGAAMSFSSAILSYNLVGGYIGAPINILIIIGVGAVIGLANGIGIRKIGISPFAMTFGMLFVLEGITLTIRPYTGGEISEVLVAGWNFQPYSIPVLALITLAGFALVFWYFLDRTALGLHLLSVGENEEVSKRAGVDPDRMKILAHVIAGCLAMVAGLFMALRIEAGSPTLGERYLLLSIAAPVVGGTALSGGKTSSIGILGGAAVLALVSRILTFSPLPEPGRWIVRAIVIIIMLAFAGWFQR